MNLYALCNLWNPGDGWFEPKGSRPIGTCPTTDNGYDPVGRSVMRQGIGAGRNAIRRMTNTVRAGAAKLRPLTDRRRFGRFNAGRLGCDLGRVMDLSGGGMRVRCPRRASGLVEVQLWTAKRRVTVQAKIVWARRIGFRRYELGLEFRDVTPETRQDLSTFAAYLAAG